MSKEERPFCCHQNFVPNGLSAHARGYIHMVKHEKNVYISDFKAIFQNFVPNGLSAHARGYIHMVKHEKNVYISDFKVIFFNLQQIGKVIRAFC